MLDEQAVLHRLSPDSGRLRELRDVAGRLARYETLTTEIRAQRNELILQALEVGVDAALVSRDAGVARGNIKTACERALSARPHSGGVGVGP